MKRVLGILSGVILLLVLNLTIMPRLSTLRREVRKESFRIFLSPGLEKWSSFEFRVMKAFLYTLNLRVYLGKLIEESPVFPPEAETNIIKTAEVVTTINPYYYDIYYICNGFLTWDFNNAETANKLLLKAVKYRPKDWFFYFMMGFNYFYFLHDYEMGGTYIQKAAQIRNSPFLASLAARLMYASGRTEIAIQMLRSMIRNIKDENWKKSLSKRLKALEAVLTIQRAVEKFMRNMDRTPVSIEELLEKGFLQEKPEDPYGGRFYIDEEGNVKTTSNFLPKEGKGEIE